VDRFRSAAALMLLGSVLSLRAGETLKTLIKGARMDVIKKGEAVEFKGGVTLTRGRDFLSADRMINREGQGLTQAWGHVYLRRLDPTGTLVWEAWGDEALYDANASSGTLWGRGGACRAKRSSLTGGPATAPLFLESDKLTFFELAEKPAAATQARATGRVYVDYTEPAAGGRRTRVWSDRADYDGAGRKIRFEDPYPAGGPRASDRPPWPEGAKPRVRVWQQEGASGRDIAGDSVVFFESDSRVVVEGNVMAYLEGDKTDAAPR
jgi:hypothetical protein